MEHAYDNAQPAASPWRTAAIVASGVAAVELFILVVLGVALGTKLIGDHAEKAITQATGSQATDSGTAAGSAAGRKTASSQSAAPAHLPRNRTSVIVLNGSGISGAAAVTSDRVRHLNYIVAATGNAPRSDFQRSVVMYRAGFEGEARRLAHDLHLRRVAPLDGLRAHDLRGAHLALIIGG